MKAAYRINRIPVTDNIRNTMFDLITKENDIETKKKHPAKWYRNETASRLKLDENGNPSLRSYEDLVNEIRNYLKKRNPLDEPWSYGSLIDYPIPLDLIVEIWRICDKKNKLGSGERLTIREVRWYVILRSIPFGYKAHSKIQTPDRRHWTAMMTAKIYARFEQQCELANKRPDTWNIDSETLEKMDDNLIKTIPISSRKNNLS